MGVLFLVDREEDYKNYFKVTVKADRYSDLETIIKYFMNNHENLHIHMLVSNDNDKILDGIYFWYDADTVKEKCINALKKYRRLFFCSDKEDISFSDKSREEFMSVHYGPELTFLLKTSRSVERLVHELKKTGAIEFFETLPKNQIRDCLARKSEHKRLVDEFIMDFNLKLHDVYHVSNRQLFFSPIITGLTRLIARFVTRGRLLYGKTRSYAPAYRICARGPRSASVLNALNREASKISGMDT
jgi:hypothetical protein